MASEIQSNAGADTGNLDSRAVVDIESLNQIAGVHQSESEKLAVVWSSLYEFATNLIYENSELRKRVDWFENFFGETYAEDIKQATEGENNDKDNDVEGKVADADTTESKENKAVEDTTESEEKKARVPYGAKEWIALHIKNDQKKSKAANVFVNRDS